MKTWTAKVRFLHPYLRSCLFKRKGFFFTPSSSRMAQNLWYWKLNFSASAPSKRKQKSRILGWNYSLVEDAAFLIQEQLRASKPENLWVLLFLCVVPIFWKSHFCSFCLPIHVTPCLKPVEVTSNEVVNCEEVSLLQHWNLFLRAKKKKTDFEQNQIKIQIKNHNNNY